MREIVFDTETTGLNPAGGDRVVEIGCVELFNHIPTGNTFHRYINPERSMPVEAMRVHGLDDRFLSDKPVFAAIAAELVAFIGDAPMIAHNAEFDLAFLNAEFGRCGQPALEPERIVDSLMLARRKHPAGPNSLDALCARYQIDTSQRTLHGALLDSYLLAEVYVELTGGRQIGLELVAEVAVEALHESAGRHREALDTMARRLREAITNAQRDKAFELAERLRALLRAMLCS